MGDIDIPSHRILSAYFSSYKLNYLLFSASFPLSSAASSPGTKVHAACWAVIGWGDPDSLWVLYSYIALGISGLLV